MRIRAIKPEFFTHEGLFELENEHKLPVRIAFAGLWCAADREGRFKWEPRRLGVQILPYDNIDFSRVLHALSTRGFVVQYRVGDACFGCIPGFKKHQVINNRESPSAIPSLSEGEIVEAKDDAKEAGTRDPRVKPRVTHACSGEGKGREGRSTENDASNERVGNPVSSMLADVTRNKALQGVTVTQSNALLTLPSDNAESREQRAEAVICAEGRVGELPGIHQQPVVEPKRNELIDALVSVDGTNPLSATRPMFGQAAKALSLIREVCPDVTAEEIFHRLSAYKTKFPGASVSSTAIAKHWGGLNGAIAKKRTGIQNI